jgi:predicted RNA-binding protein with PIN domain
MRWLIDGYNVIRRDPALAGAEAQGLEEGRAALLRVVANAARASGDPFTVVFDGAGRWGGTPAGGQVQVVFSRPPESADDVLRRLAAQLRSGAVVVSSDRAVRDAAERAADRLKEQCRDRASLHRVAPGARPVHVPVP